MFKRWVLLVIIILYGTNHSYQNEISDESSTRLNNHDDIFQEMQEQELMIAENVEQDFSEGSGNFEGSGNIRKTNAEGTVDIKNCIEAGYSAVCSNQGNCVDNRCICNFVQFSFDNSTVFYHHTGRYCEECPYCRAQRCHQYLPCIECNLLRKGANCINYCQFQYEIVEKVTRNIDNDEKFCDIENTDGCFFKFKYYYNTQNSVVVQYEGEMFCFDGLKFIIYLFWSVVIYVFALTLLVPRICSCSRQAKVGRSRTSLSSRGYDILRLHVFR